MFFFKRVVGTILKRDLGICQVGQFETLSRTMVQQPNSRLSTSSQLEWQLVRLDCFVQYHLQTSGHPGYLLVEILACSAYQEHRFWTTSQMPNVMHKTTHSIYTLSILTECGIPKSEGTVSICFPNKISILYHSLICTCLSDGPARDAVRDITS